MKQRSNNIQSQASWGSVVMRKWLNMGTNQTDYTADDPDDQNDPDSDSDAASHTNQDCVPRLRRQKSLTSRAEYINKKELKICVGTWNVGGEAPPDDLDIDDWLCINHPADIYVLGFQEIVPLNPGNIFGAEDTRRAPKWENIIRETLNRVRPPPPKMKSFSDPPSPSRFKPSADIPDVAEEILLEESDSDIGEEVHPFNEEEEEQQQQDDDDNKATKEESQLPSYPRKLNRLNCFRNEDLPSAEENMDTSMLSGTGRIGLSWPEQPMHLQPQKVLEKSMTFKSSKSFKTMKSFRTYGSFKPTTMMMDDIALLGEIDLEALMRRKRRSSYVRIVSKQMVGLFITIWVRRNLRKHIQNLKVSTVGVGVMGYIGNKGSISISMSIYQTMFCFICTHLTAGEKEGDELRRNADVREIHHRTHFHSVSDIQLPMSILDHERIIWLGDLNYRINLSYEKTRDLISKKQWSKLLEKDQLAKEIEKGVFRGWSEGELKFAPTYKYESNSDKYCGEDPNKIGRRVPSWCDRVVWYGSGLRLVSYTRAELKLSDHRPVTATYMAEVEVFSPRKLQKALTFTDAEIDNAQLFNNFPNWNI
ncbi:Type I inositol 1,4,5-trisphosphate 5-phosphatase [Stylosanthes scabra]|uniref:Type I inositol 1,4,5-trisphosphate 5-phosphatase n=1 Tax=Stylosanthes scabra TaxID=79078 RepID=A0ABU6R4S1_9FABA|nr:Type I inositol 1,4,5-trisphosphate 5-phosphatase [Stylosanthes scabra]